MHAYFLPLAFVVLWLVWPIDALAQLDHETETGSRIPLRSERVDAGKAAQMRKRFGRCLLSEEADLSARIMQYSDPLAIDWKRVGVAPEKFSERSKVLNCLALQSDSTAGQILMSGSETVFRSMLLEEAYLDRFKVVPDLSPDAVEIVERTYVSPEKNQPYARGLGVFADCIVFHDTVRADALLRTKPANEDEMSVARALAPTLGACLTKGFSLKLTPANIRSIVADGLWTRYVRNVSAVQLK